MIVLNDNMFELLRRRKRKTYLPRALSSLLENGFVYVEGCLFFKQYYKANEHLVTEDALKDKTALEGLMNHFHLEDCTVANDLDTMLLFLKKFVLKAKEFPEDLVIRVIISYHRGEIIFRFHTKHEGECDWLEDKNLDDYTSGLLAWEFPTRQAT